MIKIDLTRSGFLLVMFSQLFFFCDSGSKEEGLFLEEPLSGQSVNIEINEASGIVASRRYPGLLWTHNDSGDKPRLFLIKPEGDLVATVYLEDVFNRDWEDIAAHYDREEDKYFLFIGDIGDNRAIYDYKYIYRIEEPLIDIDKSEQLIFVSDVERIVYQYADGSRDAETLLFDPIDERLYLISKREEQVGLYLFAPGFNWGDTLSVNKVAELSFTYIVAGDVSSDGTEILIKNYNEVFYWRREGGESLEKLLRKEPTILPYQVERQGEAIAWDIKSEGYYTLSEQSEALDYPKVYFYKRK